MLFENNYTIGVILFYENQTFINLNNYFIEKLEYENKLNNLNINFFELSDKGEIINKYYVQNYELNVEKDYPNGERCKPVCYTSETIYLMKN